MARQHRQDNRGLVAVVRATTAGPAVTFPYGRTMAESLRSACAVWGERDGETFSYPRAFFVQVRGQWVPA